MPASPRRSTSEPALAPDAKPLVAAARRLSRAVGRLRFEPPVTHVQDPLQYARGPAEDYLARWGAVAAGERRRVLLLGMNPGPWGMAQTGVPFGEVAAVRDFLGVTGRVRRPRGEHPRRPVQGFDCPRSEVSGRRVWAWVAERFGTPEAFFAHFFVWNYCPLVFMEEGGRNRTPDKLPAAEREPLFRHCDRALLAVIDHLRPEWVVGVGGFAERRLRTVLAESGRDGETGETRHPRVGVVLHPSPASPMANRGWAPQVDRQLAELGILD